MPQSESRPMKSVEQLEAELAEAERIAQRVREQLEQARWLREYDDAPPAANHPLSKQWPSMPVAVFEAFRDGVRPPPREVIDAMIASDWFQSLGKSQRALFSCNWFHLLKRGSNQHKRIIRTDTVRNAAELAQAAIREQINA